MDILNTQFVQDVKFAVGRIMYWIRSLYRIPTVYTGTELLLRQRVHNLIRLYNGDQLELTKMELDKQFASPDRLKLQIQFSNIIRFITDSLCQTVSNGIIVSAEDEKDSELIDEIIDTTKFESFVQTLERYLFLCKTVFVKVSYRNDAIALDLITSAFTDVVQDENCPDEFTQIVYPQFITKMSVSQPEGSFHLWTKDEYKLVDHAGNEIPVQGADGTNPYGIIPIVKFNEQLNIDGEILQFPGEELVNAQFALNAKLTSLNFLIKMQSFSIPVFYNPPQDQFGNVDIQIDPSRPLVCKGDKDTISDIKFITPDAKITELQESINMEYMRIGNLYGIDMSGFINSAQRPSAETMIQLGSRVSEYRRSIKTMLTPRLVELFEVIKTVWNVNNPSKQLVSDVTIEIQDAPRSEMAIDDYIKKNDWRLAHDMTTVAELLVEERADLSLEEAEQILMDNADTNKISGEVSTLNTMQQPSGSDMVQSGSMNMMMPMDNKMMAQSGSMNMMN